MNRSDQLLVQLGDITQFQGDAIVNAANERMLGGGGVDGAIHRAAGTELLEACRTIPEVRPGVRCPTGEARITPGFNLSAKWVIHTVGPVWHGGDREEEQLPASCYSNSLELASENEVSAVAFPAISTGVYRFPLDRATEIAVESVLDFLTRESSQMGVTFFCFSEELKTGYRTELARKR